MSTRFRRTMACLPAVATAAFIYFISDGPLPPGTLPAFRFSDKLAHALAFGFFTLTLVPAFHIGLAMGRSHVLRHALLIGILYVALDEVHQGWVPGREKDIGDFIADAIGAGLAIFIVRQYWKPQAPHDLSHPISN